MHIRSKKLLIIAGAAVLIVIIAIIALGNRSSDSNQSSTATINRPSAAENTVATGKTFQFPQLGVEIDLPQGLQGLNYRSASQVDSNQETLYLTTDRFKAATAACGYDTSSSFADIYRVDGIADGTVSNVLKQFDGFYVKMGNGNYGTNCTPSLASEEFASSIYYAEKALESAFMTARPISQ